MALAQLTPTFLFAAKSNPLASYAGYNVLHRWAGRILFLSAMLHGTMWINQHRRYGVAIIGEVKETYGMAAFGTLCILVLSSIRWVRRWVYEVFMALHLIAFPTFFILICYHTPYALPWVFPPLAIYGFDVLSRMLRAQVRDAVLEARGEGAGGMTIVRFLFPS
jgi:ferric-chelate reductase